MKGVRIFLADGFEDMEALAVCDVLRRGGVEVELTAIADVPTVLSSHGVGVTPDSYLSSLDSSSEAVCDKDVMIFPGGMPGSKKLAGCEELMRLMKTHYDEGGTVAAICAAPGLVLSQLDGLEGLKFTCFDGFENCLLSKGAVFTAQPYEVCGRVITGRSAGHAPAFGLAILEYLRGAEASSEVRHALYLD